VGICDDSRRKRGRATSIARVLDVAIADGDIGAAADVEAGGERARVDVAYVVREVASDFFTAEEAAGDGEVIDGGERIQVLLAVARIEGEPGAGGPCNIGALLAAARGIVRERHGVGVVERSREGGGSEIAALIFDAGA